MKNVDWNDLKFFVAVAHSGSLTAAAAELDSSPATVGRRMVAIERAVGRPLFVRRQTGYEPTVDGRSLLARAKLMHAGARSVADWIEADGQRSLVRLSAGTWTTNFLAENFARLWSPDDPFRIAFKTTEAKLDLAHREAEIGVRNGPPESQNLAGRRTVTVALAPFRARGTAARDQAQWVAISPQDIATRSARWVAGRTDITVAAWANTPVTSRDLIRAGVGIGVLPCFVGDRDPLLERAGDEIAELREAQWLVMHNDDRHRPDVRAVIDRLVALVEAHAPLFEGQRPVGGG